MGARLDPRPGELVAVNFLHAQNVIVALQVDLDPLAGGAAGDEHRVGHAEGQQVGVTAAERWIVVLIGDEVLLLDRRDHG